MHPLPLSIFGMIIAIGLLIDNAIVMTDEVKRKLDAGADRPGAVRQALSHLFVPLLASTLTTILGFMPIFLLPGAMGDFVGSIAIAVVLALSASFFVATTITPALAGTFLRRREDRGPRRWWVDGFRSERLSSTYRNLLRGAISRPAITIPACLVLPVLGFILAGTLGQQFFPPADRDQFEIEVWLAPDASIGKTESVVAALSYEKAVLTALADAESAISAYTEELQTHENLSAAADASSEAAELAQKLYEKGLADFLTVLDAQRRRDENEDARAQKPRTTAPQPRPRLQVPWRRLGIERELGIGRNAILASAALIDCR